MRLRDYSLIWTQDHLRLIVIHVQCTENENETRKWRVRRDGFEPVIVQIEQYHLRFGCLQDEISKLLNLECGLERQLQFTGTNNNIREIKKMHFKRIQHTFPRDDNLMRLFFYRERPNQSGSFFSCLPFRQLTKTFLTRPHRRMNNFEEQLTGSWIEDKDGTIDWLRGQIPFKGLVNRYTVYIGIVNKPDGIFREEVTIILRVEERFGGLGGVQLQTLANTLPQNIQRRIRLLYLGHGLLYQGFHTRDPVAIG